MFIIHKNTVEIKLICLPSINPHPENRCNSIFSESICMMWLFSIRPHQNQYRIHLCRLFLFLFVLVSSGFKRNTDGNKSIRQKRMYNLCGSIFREKSKWKIILNQHINFYVTFVCCPAGWRPAIAVYDKGGKRLIVWVDWMDQCRGGGRWGWRRTPMDERILKWRGWQRWTFKMSFQSCCLFWNRKSFTQHLFHKKHEGTRACTHTLRPTPPIYTAKWSAQQLSHCH